MSNNRLNHIKILNSTNNKRYYKPIKYPEIPLTINDLYIITSMGDRLDLLADRFYGDTQLWWVISMANMIEIRIPSNLRAILKNFEQLNENINQSY